MIWELEHFARVGERDEHGTAVLSVPRFTEWLAGRIEERTPAAMVRFGDGEEAVVEASHTDEGAMALATAKLVGQTGARLPPRDVIEIGQSIERAYEQADVLGILSVGGNEEQGPSALRYLERIAAGNPPAALTYRLLHHGILERLPELLSGRLVGVVSCRDVKPVIEADWGLRDVVIHQIPSEHKAREVDGSYEAALHGTPIWPDVYNRLKAELTIRERGEVFLVGAGILGKGLSLLIRDHGGIALDMGSALDRIAGKITRGPKRRARLKHARGLSVTEITADMESFYGTKLDRAKIQALIEAPSPRPDDKPFDLDWARAQD